MALLIPVEGHLVCQCGAVSPKHRNAFLIIRGIIGHGVWSGCVAAFQTSVDYSVQMAGGFRNALFGGEGLFLTTLMGPGKVYLQTLPFSRLLDRTAAAVPQ